MIPLTKIQPTATGARYLVENFLSKSAVEYREEIVHSVIRNRAALWTIGLGGFMVVSVYETEFSRQLCIECFEGKGILNGETMLSVLELAKQEHCEAVICQTKRCGIVRMLACLGFDHYPTADGWFQLWRKVNGRK